MITRNQSVRNLFALWLVASIVLISSNPALAQSDEAPAYRISHYDMDVEILPADKFISVGAVITIQGLADRLNVVRIFLHKDFIVRNVSSDGQSLKFSKLDQVKTRPMYSPTAAAIDIHLYRPLSKNETQKIEIAYSGEIKRLVNGVNMISEHLTELANYCSWYPLLLKNSHFSYSMRVTLPLGQKCVTDGELLKETQAEGKVIRWFERDDSGFNDIPLIASDEFKVEEINTSSIQAAIYYKDLEPHLAKEEISNAVDCASFYAQKFGDPAVKGKITSVCSPRQGWGYSRIPLIIGSEGYIMELLRDEAKKIKNFRGIAHEVGHFWWNMADSSSTNDWINEALAEFSSLCALENFFGREAVNEILRKYTSDILKVTAKKAKPIIDTLRNDNNAYVLYYEKGAYIFEMLRAFMREEKLFRTLKRFYRNHCETRWATTNDLIDTFIQEVGENIRPFFEELLTTSTLPNLNIEWHKHGLTVEGRVVLENTKISDFPLEITFAQKGTPKEDTRIVLISPGKNIFKFELPFQADTITVDKNQKLLKSISVSGSSIHLK